MSKGTPKWVCPHCGAVFYSAGWGKPRFCPKCRRTAGGDIVKNPRRRSELVKQGLTIWVLLALGIAILIFRNK